MPRTLLRRAYFDLTGLPPSPEQTDSFLKAAAGNLDAAYSSLLDELLASTHYGERWGRHWLDLVVLPKATAMQPTRTERMLSGIETL